MKAILTIITIISLSLQFDTQTNKLINNEDKLSTHLQENPKIIKNSNPPKNPNPMLLITPNYLKQDAQKIVKLHKWIQANNFDAIQELFPYYSNNGSYRGIMSTRPIKKGESIVIANQETFITANLT